MKLIGDSMKVNVPFSFPSIFLTHSKKYSTVKDHKHVQMQTADHWLSKSF